MKKTISIIIAITILFSSVISVNAADSYHNIREEEKQAQIEDAINELNKLAAIKAHQEYLISNDITINYSLYDINQDDKVIDTDSILENYDQLVCDIDQKLHSLGVRKIDVDDPQDMDLLEELSASEVYQGLNTATSNSSIYDTAPDLKAIAGIYTLYIYDGSVNSNGTTYYYRYIKVVDNKGYNGLTKNQTISAIGNVSQQLGTSILKFNFEYGVESLIGLLPGGVVLNWTLGNIFTVLSNLQSVQITSNNSNIYTINHCSVTSMTYYYFYNNGWKLIGVGAVAQVTRDDHFLGNVNGYPKSDFNSTSFSITSRGIWRDYVDSYINNMGWNPSYCLINKLGGLSVECYSQNAYFEPCYATSPSDVI